MKTNTAITHEDISLRARQIWEQAGKPEGQDAENWLRAERELQQDRPPAASIPSGSAAKGSRSRAAVR